MSEKVVQIIQQILDPKTTSQDRKQCEEQLKGGVLENPSQFVQILVQNCQNNTDEAIRSFCVVQIRKNLSTYSEKNYPN